MLVENWDKLFGENLFTSDTMYSFDKDTMTVAPLAHVARITPMSGKGNTAFTIVITKIENSIRCGIYVDRVWNPIEIFDMSRMDLKSMDTFKKLLSYKIANHE
jgi:hypothetical protein